MSELILHIPHASDCIPKLDGYLVDREFLNKEILTLTDWYTDTLFTREDCKIIKANFSRVFCDVERFAEDKQEVMASFGMGVFYTKAEDGSVMRNISADLRKNLLDNYYYPHHQKLEKAVEKQLAQNNKALIVDCHSFPDIPLARDLNKTPNRPDFNIGTDAYHSPKWLVDFSQEYFESRGFSVVMDWPYSGSIVPLKYYQNNKNVMSIMIEVNRSLYLKGTSNQKSKDFDIIKKHVQEFLENLKNQYEQ